MWRSAVDAAEDTQSTRSPKGIKQKIWKKIDVPTLIMHGTDNQIVPIEASAMMSSKLVCMRQARPEPAPA